ncbi:MAG TPA: hypothetical protein VNX29_16600 [Kaistia sp.]|nr:hypothetical protein [Kaistia sp.]
MTSDGFEEPHPRERSVGYLRLKVGVAQKRLARSLGLVDRSDDFIRMIWSIDKIGEGKEIGWQWFTKRPRYAVEFALGPHNIHKWTLESLVNAYLLSKPLHRRNDRPSRYLDTHNLASPLQLLQMMNDRENADDGLTLRRVSVFDGMRRLAQRQFHWQRGKLNKTAFFKSAYSYNFQEASDHFFDKYNVSIDEFCFTGFVITSMLQKHAAIQVHPLPDLKSKIDLRALGQCFSLYSQTEASLRRKAAAMRQVTAHSAYQSSILRQWPCLLIETDNIIICPIPDLVVERYTDGLYYDLVDNNGELRNEIAHRFEEYCKLILSSHIPEIEVVSEFEYNFRKNRVKSPDIFLCKNNETIAVIECKAKRAPISVRFGDTIDPLTDPAFEDLAKGAFQIWGFVSRVRRGLASVAQGKLAADAIGIVVLMDTWLELSTHQIDDVLNRARDLCRSKEPEIQLEDQIPLTFCNIDDLHDLLRSSTTIGALRSLREATKPERYGWLLTSIQRQVAPDAVDDKGHSLDPYMDDVIKWWPRATAEEV